MTDVTHEAAVDREPRDDDWDLFVVMFQEIEHERTLRELAGSFDEIVAGKRKLTDHDRSMIQILDASVRKAHLAAAVDGFASELAVEQNFLEKGPRRQIDDRAQVHRRLLKNTSPLLTCREVDSSLASETVLLWASLDAVAFRLLSDPDEFVSAACQIVRNFDCAEGRYGRALYDVNPEVFDTVSQMYGLLFDACCERVEGSCF